MILPRKFTIFSQQQQFAENDLVGAEKKYIPFSNILDKGYRCVLLAHRAEGQEYIQPIFAKIDLYFIGDDSVVIASIAFDHSSNERGIQLSKKTGFIKQGLTSGYCPKRLNYVWLAWGYQVNLMFAAVL